MIFFRFETNECHDGIFAEIDVVLSRVCPHPVNILCVRLLQQVGLVAQIFGSEFLVVLIIVVDTKVGFND